MILLSEYQACVVLLCATYSTTVAFDAGLFHRVSDQVVPCAPYISVSLQGPKHQQIGKHLARNQLEKIVENLSALFNDIPYIFGEAQLWAHQEI